MYRDRQKIDRKIDIQADRWIERKWRNKQVDRCKWIQPGNIAHNLFLPGAVAKMT